MGRAVFVALLICTVILVGCARKASWPSGVVPGARVDVSTDVGTEFAVEVIRVEDDWLVVVCRGKEMSFPRDKVVAVAIRPTDIGPASAMTQ